MSLPSGACDIPDPTCCMSLHDIANQILVAAHDAVLACQVDTACEQGALVGYVAMGARTEDPVSDYLTVALARLDVPFISERNQKVQNFMPEFRAFYRVTLLESGYPTPQDNGDEIIVPDPALVHAVAAHAYAHGEAMYRALAHAVAKGAIGGPGCGVVRLGGLDPIQPSGGSTGWTVDLEIAVRFSGPIPGL